MLRIVAVLLFTAALVLGLRAFDIVSSGDHAKPKLSTPANSDYYMTDAVVHKMDKHGNLAYRMRAARILHYPDDSARLTDIAVHYLGASRTYWDVTAKRGRVPPGKRDIYIYDGVTGHHPDPDGGTVKVVTDNAWVRPDANRIDTKAHVTAIEPGQKVEGDGMEVNLETDKLRLLNNVHVTYTP